MPEGDTLHKTAARLQPALQGHRLTRFEAPRLRGGRPQLGEEITLCRRGASTSSSTSRAASSCART